MDEQHLKEHSKIHSRINTIDQDVSGMKAQIKSLEKGQLRVEAALENTSTKDDLNSLRSWLEKRDESREKEWGDKMWYIIKFLLYLFGALVIVFFGLQEAAKIFFGG